MNNYDKAALCLLAVVSASAVFVMEANAACKVQWVDHDFNMSTPAIQKQICDSSLDLPAINLPGVRPIQAPQIRPIPSIGLAPLGTSSCTNQSVFENGRWVTRRLCN